MTRMIRTPDGLRFPMPDDATDDQVNQAIRDIQRQKRNDQQQPATAAPAATTAPWDVPDPETGVPGGARRPGELERAAAAKAAEPSLVDMIMGTADVFARRAGEGVLNVAGLPVDAVNNLPRLINLLPGDQGFTRMSDRPVFGGDFNNAVWDTVAGGLSGALGHDRQPLPPDEDLPWYQQLAGRVGSEAGGALVPVGGALLRAGQVGVKGARAALAASEPETVLQSLYTAPKRVADQMVESAAVNPGKFAANEVLASTAAGAGAGVANQMVDPHTRTGAVLDLVGALAGAASGAGIRGLTGSIDNLINAFRGSPAYIDDVVKEAVIDRIAEASGLQKEIGRPVDTDELVKIIMSGDRVSHVVPGVQESLADRTRNPGLAALEYSRQSGPNAGLFTQKSSQNNAAIASAIEGNAPKATPGAFRNELETARQEQLTAARQSAQAAEDAMTAASRPLSASMTGEARGADIRAVLEQASDAANETVRQAWRPINESPHTLDTRPLADQYAAVDQGLSVAERRRFRPGEADIPAELAGEQAEQSINEITGLRSALTDAAREARNAGQANRARIIDQHIQALDTYLDDNVPAALRSQYDVARATRRDVADRFDRPQTAIAQTLQRREGQYAQPDSAIARKFVQDDQGRIADFEALMRESGGDSRVQGAIRDQVLQDVADRGLLQNPQALDDYLARYNTLLGRFPRLRGELGNAASLRRAVEQAQTAETATQRSLGTPERPGSSATGKYLAYSEENADRAMANVMGSKDPVGSIDELLNRVRNQPQAVEGAKRAFWNLMEKQARSSGSTTRSAAGDQPWRATSLKNFLDDPRNAAVLDRLYRDDPQHLDNLKQIVEAVQGLDIRVTAKARNSSGTAQSVLPSAETTASRLFAYKRGQVGANYLVASIGATIARRLVGQQRTAAIDRMLDQALLDPDAAAMLLKENNPANREALKRWAKGWWGGEAAQIVDDMGSDDKPDDESDDIVKTIMREPPRSQGAERHAFGGPR